MQYHGDGLQPMRSRDTGNLYTRNHNYNGMQPFTDLRLFVHGLQFVHKSGCYLYLDGSHRTGIGRCASRRSTTGM